MPQPQPVKPAPGTRVTVLLFIVTALLLASLGPAVPTGSADFLAPEEESAAVFRPLDAAWLELNGDFERPGGKGLPPGTPAAASGRIQVESPVPVTDNPKPASPPPASAPPPATAASPSPGSGAIRQPETAAPSPENSAGQIVQGRASHYGEGDGLHGRPTASGEIFNAHDFTAAHRTLPFGTRVRVTYFKTGLTVEVRVNDRGPFHGDLIIDLSAAAARQIGLFADGIGLVELEILEP